MPLEIASGGVPHPAVRVALSGRLQDAVAAEAVARLGVPEFARLLWMVERVYELGVPTRPR